MRPSVSASLRVVRSSRVYSRKVQPARPVAISSALVASTTAAVGRSLNWPKQSRTIASPAKPEGIANACEPKPLSTSRGRHGCHAAQPHVTSANGHSAETIESSSKVPWALWYA